MVLLLHIGRQSTDVYVVPKNQDFASLLEHAHDKA